MKLVMATEMGLRQKGAGDSEERERDSVHQKKVATKPLLSRDVSSPLPEQTWSCGCRVRRGAEG